MIAQGRLNRIPWITIHTVQFLDMTIIDELHHASVKDVHVGNQPERGY